MTIESTTQQVAVQQPAKVAKAQKPAPVTAAPEVVKAPPTADKVEVSTNPALTAELNELQAVQAKKVAEIKARVEAGTYRVSTRDVAEKMLSKLSRNKG